MHGYYAIWSFGFYHGGSAEISMNSMSRKGQQLNLDQEMSLVKGLSCPDFGASCMSMQVALGLSLWYSSGVINPLCLLHFDSYSKLYVPVCATLTRATLGGLLGLYEFCSFIAAVNPEPAGCCHTQTCALSSPLLSMGSHGARHVPKQWRGSFRTLHSVAPLDRRMAVREELQVLGASLAKMHFQHPLSSLINEAVAFGKLGVSPLSFFLV